MGRITQIFFDGLTVNLIDENNEVFGTFSAISGVPGYQNPDYQNLADKGPLPEGNYSLKLSDIDWRDTPAEYIAWGSGWGHARVTLTPSQGMELYGRNGFFLHGSLASNGFGSKGCIDVSIADTVLFKILEQFGAETIQVIVNYAEVLHTEPHPLLSGVAPESYISDAAAAFDRAFTSPIVFDLDNNGFGLLHAQDGVHFDIDADGFAEKTGWIKPTEAFLVRDVNGNGVIDSQAEMFGTDATSTAAQKLAA